nr:hypothetical protein [Tanacetum cinerariifolium]
MDYHDITMEEYIQLEAKKAHRHGQAFNYETATNDMTPLPPRAERQLWLREFILALGLHTTEEIDIDRFRAYWDIRWPLRRLCHRLIAFTIARRGQTPMKVTTTDLYNFEEHG